MLLTTGDRTTMLAALRFAAMAFDRKAKTDEQELRFADARMAAAFSVECFRVATLVEKG